MFKELNPLLHSELRLAVVSILIGVESADFVFIRQQTGATAGNLSVQLDKLAKAGYIEDLPRQDSLHGVPHHRRRARRLRRLRRGAAKLYKEINMAIHRGYSSRFAAGSVPHYRLQRKKNDMKAKR